MLTSLTEPETLQTHVRTGVEGERDPHRQGQNVVRDKVEEGAKMLAA